jgi:hypothetical protein
MDNLEKNLLNLPKPKLSKKADLKIKVRIYLFLFAKSLDRVANLFASKRSLLSRVVFTLIVALVILGGASVYASTSDEITLGNVFYPLKKTIENVEQNLALTKTSQINTLNKFSEKRLKEALNLAQEKDENDETNEGIIVSNNIKQTINEAIDNIDSAVKTTQRMKNDENAQEAKNNIKKHNDSLIQYLDDIGSLAKDNQNEEVVNKVKEAKDVINKYNKDLDNDKEERHDNFAPKNNNKEEKNNSDE